MSECKECNGKGTKLIREFKLFETCKKCHGDGEFNWLDKILGKRTEFYDKCLRNNLTILVECLTEYCHIKGLEVEIKINGRNAKIY